MTLQGSKRFPYLYCRIYNRGMTTGSELRDRRESAGLSIEQLASLTSIRMGLITEME